MFKPGEDSREGLLWSGQLVKLVGLLPAEENRVAATSLAILVAYLTCNKDGVISRPARFLPLMLSSKSFLYSF